MSSIPCKSFADELKTRVSFLTTHITNSKHLCTLYALPFLDIQFAKLKTKTYCSISFLLMRFFVGFFSNKASLKILAMGSMKFLIFLSNGLVYHLPLILELQFFPE